MEAASARRHTTRASLPLACGARSQHPPGGMVWGWDGGPRPFPPSGAAPCCESQPLGHESRAPASAPASQGSWVCAPSEAVGVKKPPARGQLKCLACRGSCPPEEAELSPRIGACARSPLEDSQLLGGTRHVLAWLLAKLTAVVPPHLPAEGQPARPAVHGAGVPSAHRAGPGVLSKVLKAQCSSRRELQVARTNASSSGPHCHTTS